MILALGGIVIAYVSAFLVFLITQKEIGLTQKYIVFAVMGFPSATYVLLAYVIGLKIIPPDYLGTVIFFFSIGVLGGNLGRAIMFPELLREVKKNPKVQGKALVINTSSENGSIFILVMYLHGYIAYTANDWNGLPVSPHAFLIGIEIMSIAAFIGGIVYGLVVRNILISFEEENIRLDEGFRKLIFISSFPQVIVVTGMLLAILEYMGTLTL